MTREKFSLRRRQIMVGGAMGVSVIAVPTVVMGAHEPVLRHDGDRMVVSGRVVSDADGQALAGAQIEIWPADARGVRDARTREVVTADGDGRYFATLNGNLARVYYRVSHQGYTARVTQLHATGTRQRSVTLTRDTDGATRAAFEMSLAPRTALASVTPDTVVL